MPSAKAVVTTPSRSAKTCTVDGCKRKNYRAKGYCNVHYRKWRQGDLPRSRYTQCSKEACSKRRSAGAFCGAHQPGKKAEGE